MKISTVRDKISTVHHENKSHLFFPKWRSIESLVIGFQEIIQTLDCSNWIEQIIEKMLNTVKNDVLVHLNKNTTI